VGSLIKKTKKGGLMKKVALANGNIVIDYADNKPTHAFVKVNVNGKKVLKKITYKEKEVV
tara:strand:+ start:254 stop:433 length:180 start_codon:yes stop_codon:yes gene_type:complete